MKKENHYNAGEVTVNTMDHVSEFEKKSIYLLRHAEKLFDSDSMSDVPQHLRKLFENGENRSTIIEFLTVIAQHSMRPVVRHQPECRCIGADENVFSNILKFSHEGMKSEAMILGSLLVKSDHISNLVKKATTVAFLIAKDLSDHSKAPRPNYLKHLN